MPAIKGTKMTRIPARNRATILILSALIGASGCAHQHAHGSQDDGYGDNFQDEPLSCYGNPDHYVVEGKHYKVLDSAQNYNKVGIASWYGNKFHGHLTSTRERYDMYGMTAASPELPLPTYVRVTNLENGHSVIVKVNDRGPFKSDRVLDVSYAAAKKLGLISHGTGRVRVTALQRGQPKSLTSLAAGRILQVGSFAQRRNAENYSQHIMQISHTPVTVKAGMADNKPVYRVEVGPFPDPEALESTQKVLEMHGIKNISARFSDRSNE
jgi:rare lipoprotein A